MVTCLFLLKRIKYVNSMRIDAIGRLQMSSDVSQGLPKINFISGCRIEIFS